jgi:hypothetical protein
MGASGAPDADNQRVFLQLYAAFMYKISPYFLNESYGHHFLEGYGRKAVTRCCPPTLQEVVPRYQHTLFVQSPVDVPATFALSHIV